MVCLISRMSVTHHFVGYSLNQMCRISRLHEFEMGFCKRDDVRHTTHSVLMIGTDTRYMDAQPSPAYSALRTVSNM